MTIGGLYEFVSNKLAVCEGIVFDATSFRAFPRNDVQDASSKGACKHSFICGKTGRMIGTGFMFMAAYTMQRHQSANKVHARARGAYNTLVSQPVKPHFS
jgi:DNA-directed RNA polymerase beta subunit